VVGEAAKFRAGGTDRLLVPAPWTRTIEQLCADGVTGEVYAHEQFGTVPGKARDLLERVAQDGQPLLSEFGWVLAGAWGDGDGGRLRAVSTVGDPSGSSGPPRRWRSARTLPSSLATVVLRTDQLGAPGFCSSTRALPLRTGGSQPGGSTRYWTEELIEHKV